MFGRAKKEARMYEEFQSLGEGIRECLSWSWNKFDFVFFLLRSLNDWEISIKLVFSSNLFFFWHLKFFPPAI